MCTKAGLLENPVLLHPDSARAQPEPARVNDTLKAFPASDDLDAQRELARAAKRIVALEKTLAELAETRCSKSDAALLSSCACCLRHRTIAKRALAGIEP